MARVIFELPPQFAFSTELQIYINHINHANHLDNAQLLTLVSEARTRFFAALGYAEGDTEGLAMVVGDIVVQYQSEGFHGETLRIDMAPVDFNKYGFDLVFCITESRQGRAVAKGKLGLVFTDKQDHKVRPLPPTLLAKLGQTGV